MKQKKRTPSLLEAVEQGKPLLLLAAILSVVSIPVAVAFTTGGDHATNWAAIGTVAALIGGVISFLFSTVTYWKSSKQGDLRAHIIVGSGKRKTGSLTSHVFLAEGPTEALLVYELGLIEREAQNLLGEGPNASVIRLRSGLQKLGVWSETDVYDFDVALRTRNHVAHGDHSKLSKASLTEAVETMQRLREKVEAGGTREGGWTPAS